MKITNIYQVSLSTTSTRICRKNPNRTELILTIASGTTALITNKQSADSSIQFPLIGSNPPLHVESQDEFWAVLSASTSMLYVMETSETDTDPVEVVIVERKGTG